MCSKGQGFQCVPKDKVSSAFIQKSYGILCTIYESIIQKSGSTTTQERQQNQNRWELHLPKHNFTFIVCIWREVFTDPRFLRKFQHCIADKYITYACSRKRLKYIHGSQCLFRFKFIKTWCIISVLTNVNYSINRRFSRRNMQQNIQEIMAFVKNVLKTGFIYSVFHTVGKFLTGWSMML